MNLFGIGPAELIFVFVLALIFIGPGKMPEVAASLGKTLREFQRASAELSEALNAEVAAVQAAKEAAANNSQTTDISEAQVVASPAETSSYESISIEPMVEIAPIEPEIVASVVEAEAPSARASADVHPPVADPNGMAALPSALLEPSASMRALFAAAQARAVPPVSEPGAAQVNRPTADPTGLAPLPSALLVPSDSLRGVTVQHAAAPASANQTEA